MHTSAPCSLKLMTRGSEYLDFLQFSLPPEGGATLYYSTQRTHGTLRDVTLRHVTLRTAAVRVWTSHSVQSTGDNTALLITLLNCITPQQANISGESVATEADLLSL